MYREFRYPLISPRLQKFEGAMYFNAALSAAQYSASLSSPRCLICCPKIEHLTYQACYVFQTATVYIQHKYTNRVIIPRKRLPSSGDSERTKGERGMNTSRWFFTGPATPQCRFRVCYGLLA